MVSYANFQFGLRMRRPAYFRSVSMNSENKREQQNKRKQTSTQPKQHVICNWQTFMRHIVIVAHCGDVILCFQLYF